MINKIFTYYTKLKKREKIMVAAVIAVISVSAYTQIFYKPLAESIERDIFKIEKLNTRLAKVNLGRTETSDEAERVAKLNTECSALLKEIDLLEKKLPSKQGMSGLIGEIVDLAKQEKIKIKSMRQKIQTGKEYSMFFVEIRFDAPFHEAVRYIKRLETISPFLKIEEFEINNPIKETDKKKGLARLVLSSLLGDIPFSEKLKAKDIEGLPEKFRDIFVSKAQPFKSERKIGLKLEGITYNSEVPTGILSGEVIKEGSEIKGFKVIKILPSEVLLSDGDQNYTLSLER